jgi:cell division septation protein DedD
MHKWKDKVEFSLDNRQIFFLFFGLSVVGCFVFALGVMVGRRVNFEPAGEVAALSGESLALLDAAGDDPLQFKDGLREPATEGLPQTRDPLAPKAEPDADSPAAPGATPEPLETAAKPSSAKPAPKVDTVMAATVEPAVDNRKFTLQMKAFSKSEEAETFAAGLRAHGHDVRVEAHEIKGRIWHRVRVGSFDDWSKGLAAKEEFEKSEDTIAYVVRM